MLRRCDVVCYDIDTASKAQCRFLSSTGRGTPRSWQHSALRKLPVDAASSSNTTTLENVQSNSMSEDFSLNTVYLVQSFLDKFGIASVVTGDFGLLYHGVDVAVHVRYHDI
jgi:hypothetical protein